MWIITPDDLAQVVRDQRKRLGLSQQRLALLAGVTRQWVGMLERGKPSVEMASVLRVLSALGLRLDLRDRRLPQAGEATPPLAAGPEGSGTEPAGGTAPRRLAPSLTRRRPAEDSPGPVDEPRRRRKRGDS